MKIACYINERGSMAGLDEKGWICLYEQDAEGWAKIMESPLDMTSGQSLQAIKAGIRHAVAQFDDCEVFVVSELKGLLHAVLKEEYGFRTWKSEGALVEQLDSVARHDQDFVAAHAVREATVHTCAAPAGHSGCGGGGCGSRPFSRATAQSESGTPLPAPKPLGDGCYRINLAEILENDSSLNSKQVLVPFMACVAFKRLEVLCDHVPRWFGRELGKLNLVVASEEPDMSGKGMMVIVVPAERSQP
jgi:Fe-only nitrogenase accessory protein AnfO